MDMPQVGDECRETRTGNILHVIRVSKQTVWFFREYYNSKAPTETLSVGVFMNQATLVERDGKAVGND